MTRDHVVGAVACLIAVFIGGVTVGRGHRPERVAETAKVETTSKASERVTDLVRQIEQLTHERDAWASAAKSLTDHTVTVTRWRTAPGGVPEVEQTTRADVSQTESTKSGSKDATAAQRTSVETAKQERAIDMHAIETATRIVVDRATWSASVLAGAQLAGEKAFSLRGPLVIGVAVERRILGPLWLGVWGTTSGAAGISIKGEL